MNGALLATLEKTGSATMTPYYVLTDPLNSASILMNASGVATQTLDYLPYGDVRVNAKQTSYDSDRKYLSKINDTVTNLDYLEARYYASPIGKFVSQDPMQWGVPSAIGDPQSLNYYSYANGNPVNMSDPSGKFAIGISVGSAVVEVGSGKSFMGLNLNLGVNYVRNSETSESWIVPTVSIGFTLKLGSLLNVNYPNTVNYPSLPSDDPPMVGGAYAGAGYIPNQFGISFTPKKNMTPADLRGESSNSSLNAAKISISAQVGADGTPTFSGGGSTVRAFGGGYSISSYPVQTFTPLGSIKTSTPATTFWSSGVQYSSFTTVTTTQGPNNTILTTTSANVTRVLR